MSMIHGVCVKTIYGGFYAYTGARNWNWIGNFKSAYFCPVNYFDRFKSIPQENQKMKSQNFFCIVLGGSDTCFISVFKATFEFNVGERAIWRSNFCANRKLLDLKLPMCVHSLFVASVLICLIYILCSPVQWNYTCFLRRLAPLTIGMYQTLL